jgi:hypothetical protein
MEPESNLRQITDKQPAPAAKFIISVMIDNFPVTLEFEGRADNLRAMIDRLKAIGATPPEAAKSSVGISTDDAPICEFHGKMKQGNYGWFCPKKMGDGSWCKAKPGESK